MSGTVLERLAAVLDDLAAEAIAGVPQRDAVVALDRCRSRLDRECSRRLREVDRNSEHTVLGLKTAAAFLRSRSRVSRGESYRRVRRAREIEQLPAVDAAWAAGTITTGHVDAITTARHGADADEQFAEFEPLLVEIAEQCLPEDLSDAATAWRDALDNDLGRDGSDQRAGEQHDRTKASFSKSIDGMGFLNATFDAEGADIVDRAIKRAYQQGHHENDPRLPQQQRAAAIVAICNSYLGSQPRSGNLPHVMVITDEDTMAGDTVGWAHTSDGTRLAPDTVRKIACNAFIQRVLLGHDGVPLILGRSARLFSADQFRAMVVRDGGCRGPNCNAPPDQCEAHHVGEWAADHGLTDLDNGALFCKGTGQCHADLHDGTLRVTGNANGQLDFYDRDGKHLGTTRPRTPPTKILTRHGKQHRTDATAIHQRLIELAQWVEQRRRSA